MPYGYNNIIQMIQTGGHAYIYIYMKFSNFDLEYDYVG